MASGVAPEIYSVGFYGGDGLELCSDYAPSAESWKSLWKLKI